MNSAELLEASRFLGEEFVLWLWWRGLTDGGLSGAQDDQTACFVDDVVVLVSEHGDVKELSLKKGNPAESKEAFDALAKGMRLSKAKIRILDGDLEWVTTLNAATLDASSMKVPPTQATDPASRAADRLFMIEECLGHLERRYGTFLALRTQSGNEFKIEVDAWIQQGMESLGRTDKDGDF
jgi:recombination associated protein RdgC